MSTKLYYYIETNKKTTDENDQTIAIRDYPSETIKEITRLIAKFTKTRGYIQTWKNSLHINTEYIYPNDVDPEIAVESFLSNNCFNHQKNNKKE